ncbi:exosortase/archaeosortase family protein [Streptomyces sp. FH025]|uniref:exosortase/archaeosortase family protein n=1 Tax=Streptomyces sp. FH025 TaxID=2815937 RepID=UPI001A9D9024|nr:exosortase/archaeosortase family protein [Streptomyces sp. FH025]MBO1414919.1 archaeosortase/exosortase family protein [Streptomyces sp. FH025]
MTADVYPQPSRPSRPARSRLPQHGRTPLSGRLLAGVSGPLLLGLCGFLVVGERYYRFREMAGAQWIVSHALGLRTMLLASPDAPVLYAGGDGGFGRGIALSTGCSSALLIAPLALLSGVLLLFGSRRPTRVLLGFVLAAGLVVAANLGRLTLIVAMQNRYGDEGFGWTHVLFGSVLMMAAALIALLLFLYLITRTSTRDTEVGAP